MTSECENQMVGFHLQVLHAECKGMVEREDKVDLANMYRLLKPIAGAQRGENGRDSEAVVNLNNDAGLFMQHFIKYNRDVASKKGVQIQTSSFSFI